MANRLGVTFQQLFEMAEEGDTIPISSLCTVFAESEIISYIGEGKKREVQFNSFGRYAGAFGAALLAEEKTKSKR